MWRDDVRSFKSVNDHTSSLLSPDSGKTNTNTPTQTATRNNGDLLGWRDERNNINESASDDTSPCTPSNQRQIIQHQLQRQTNILSMVGVMIKIMLMNL